MTKNFKFYGMVTILFAIAGCKSVIDQTELYGTYVDDNPFAAEKLILSSRNEYTQQIQLNKESKVNEFRGRWKFDAQTHAVILEDPIILLDEFGRFRNDYLKPLEGSFFLKAKKGPFRALVLDVNEDTGKTRFRKID